MKTVVIYRSKTGFVKKYAEWIAKALDADLFPLDSFKPDQFAAYDAIVYGGGLYAGGINGIKFIKKHLALLKGKRIAVFATGATPARTETTNELRRINFTPEEQQQVQFFYLRGGFDYEKLGIVDKCLMALLRMKLKHKKIAGPDERGMLAAYSKPVDFTQERLIQPLVRSIKG